MGLTNYRIESGVAVVTLTNGDDGNALCSEMLVSLRERLGRAVSDGAAAVLLRAEGAEFCRGLDLDEAFAHESGSATRIDAEAFAVESGSATRIDGEDVAERVARYAALLEYIRSMPLPVVALVEGSARGGGVGLAGAADVVLASSRASFQLTEVFLNLIPAVAAAHLTPGRVAPGVLRSLALTGVPVDPERAHGWGLVDRLLAEGGEERGTRKVLRALLRASPEAVRSAKAFWAEQIESAVPRTGRAGVHETARLVCDPRTAEAVAHFRDGRLPEWTRPFRPDAPLTAAGRRAEVRASAPEDRSAGPVVVTGPEEGVLQIRLADSAGRNALSATVVTDLMAAIDGIHDRTDVRVCLLSGLPDVFCSGASRETLEGVAHGTIELAEAELAHCLLSCPVPIVVAAEGHAVGGGLVLLAAADVVVLSRDARYGAVFMELGLTPGMGCTSLLPEMMGPYLAREMMYSAGTYRGAELEALGARVHRVVPAGRVEETARAVAGRMADRSATSLRLLKRTLARPRLEALREAREHEDAMHRTLLSDPAVATGVMARFVG